MLHIAHNSLQERKKEGKKIDCFPPKGIDL